MQTDLFSIHQYENNSGSQMNLDKNRDKFSAKCRLVFTWLMGGSELKVLECANNGVSSLPRRILDLKQNGVLISDKWENGIKIWFLTNEQIQLNKRFAITNN